MKVHIRQSEKSLAVKHGRVDWRSLVCLTSLFVLLGVPASAATLRGGAAQVDITPAPGLPMYGYMQRLTKQQVATGTMDPLYARVLVLEAGSKRVAVVTLDLGRTFNESWLNRLRAQAAETSHINGLIVTASHTHSGPNILDEYPGGQWPAWQNEALDKIAGAIHQAVLHLEPVRLGSGSGTANIGYNRRRVDAQGTVTMLWSNPGKTPTTPVDATVSVIRIDRQDGTPMAILINYACHPVIFGADSLMYSADFVATTLGTVSAAFPGKPLCLFLQGADGDINPYFATTPIDQGAAEKRDWTGHELGSEAVRIAKEVHSQPSEGSLDFAEDALVFPLRWDSQKFHDGLLHAYGPLVFQDHADRLAASPPPSQLALPVTTLLINKQIAMVGMPGEPFVEFGINLRDRCPVETCLLLGYTNGYFDYLPTILAASQGGYGAGDSDTYVAIGAGERMLNHSIIRIYEMRGELRPVPVADNEARPVR